MLTNSSNSSTDRGDLVVNRELEARDQSGTMATEESESEVSISVTEFSRMQQELVDLKKIKYEGEIREKKSKKDFEETLKDRDLKFKELHKENGLLKKRVDSLETEKIVLGRDLKNVKTEFELKSKTLNDGMSVLSDDNVALKEQLTLLKEKFEEEKKELAEREEIEKRLKATIEGIHSENNELKDITEKLKSDSNDQLKKISELEKKLKELNSCCEETAVKCAESVHCDENANGVADDTVELSSEKESSPLSASVNKQDPDVGENPLPGVEGENDVKVTETDELSDEVLKSLEHKVHDLENEIREWEEKWCEREKSESSFKQKYDYLTSSYTDLESKMEEMENEFSTYKGKFNEEMDRENAKLLESVREKEKELESVVTKNNSDLAGLGDQLKLSRQEVALSNKELQKCKDELNSVRSVLQKREEKHKKYINSLKIEHEREMIGAEKKVE